jgi:hypothetical protein
MMGSQQDTGTRYFEDDASTSALFAMQLNDPIYNLTINMTAPPKGSQANASLASPDGQSGEPELRTIKMPQAVRVKNLSMTGAEASTSAGSDSNENDDADTSTPQEAVFTRATDYKPILKSISSHLAPNIRAMPLHQGPDVADLHMLPASLRRNDIKPRANVDRPPTSKPASAPRFLMRVSSNWVGSRNQVILERRNLRQDLIHSIVLKQSEINQYLLMEVTVDIALGASDAPTYFLMSNYTGPGTHMLTNLRFNVISTIFHDRNQNRYYLRIHLLPRAEKGWVLATAVSELSFLLGLAGMNSPSRGSAATTIQSRARYCRNPTFPQEEPLVMVVENAPLSVSVVVA